MINEHDLDAMAPGFRDPPAREELLDYCKEFTSVIQKALEDKAIADNWAWIFEDMITLEKVFMED